MATRYHKNTEINDGLFEVVLVKKPKNVAQLPVIVTEMLSAKLSEENFVHFSAQRIELDCEESIKWTLDGEFGGEFEKADIEVINNAIDIVI